MGNDGNDGNDDNARSNREKELQDLWASAYDGWIDVPGADDSDNVIYTRPAETTITSASSSSSPSATTPPPPPPFPSVVTSSRLFALTGFNPMGEDRPIGENRAANERLRSELESLASTTTTTTTSSPTPVAWWRAFGFAADWREDGFVVAYRPEDAAKGEAAVVAMAGAGAGAGGGGGYILGP